MVTETTLSTPRTSAPDAALMFPTLSSAQIVRIASHGLIRPMTRGEVLVEAGQTDVPFFVVKAGGIEIIQPSGLGDLLVAAHRPGQFTGGSQHDPRSPRADARPPASRAKLFS
jgi:thioredoxin reductase (NADPH)